MLVSFVLSFFPRDVLDEILNLIGSVSEGFPSYSSFPVISTSPHFYEVYRNALKNYLSGHADECPTVHTPS